MRRVGACSVTVALPDSPLFLGDLYWQYLYLWPATPTPLPIVRPPSRGPADRRSVRVNAA